MNCLQESISPEKWLNYIEGSASAAERVRLDRHIRVCPPCQEIRARLTESRQGLLKAAHAENQRACVSNTSLSRLWDSVRFRIRRNGTSPGTPAVMDLRQLRSILTSMCGEATTEGALRKATQTDARFEDHLGSIVEVMCGTRAARLVQQAAKSARKEMVA